MAGRAVRPDRTPGAFGAPPPDAPREVSQPLPADVQADRLAKARANERTLDTLPDPVVRPRVARPAVGGSGEAATPMPPAVLMPGVEQAQKPALVDAAGHPFAPRTQEVTISVPVDDPLRPALDDAAQADLNAKAAVLATTDSISALDTFLAAVRRARNAPAEPPPLTEEDRARMPAASNSESPSRGVPQPIADEGRRITGGFGDAPSVDYFPLTGEEVREVVRELMDRINEDLATDLRFTMSAVYPLVRVKVQVLVEADPQGMAGATDTVDITKARHVTPAAPALPVTVEQGIDEVNAPPDAVRQELGLRVPFKRRVGDGEGFTDLVDDVVPPSGDVYTGNPRAGAR